MKRLLMLSCLLLSPLLLVSCGKKAEKTETTPMDLDEAEHLCVKASEQVIDRFARELKSELVAAIRAKGTPSAISICAERAPQIAAAHSRPGILTIRRVSDRNRNPQNQASGAEVKVMDMFRDTSYDNLYNYSMWTETPDGQEFHYYKPIKTGAVCMQCHGPAAEIEREVGDMLKAAYPEDKATGYRVGDLRGMFVVEIKWPEGRQTAQQIVVDAL